jgi:hypothetical protein
MRRRRRDLRAIDGHDPHLDQSRLGAQREHPAEEVGDRPLVARPEARDRRVVGNLLAAITRKATSSRQRRSIPRAERTPIADA